MIACWYKPKIYVHKIDMQTEYQFVYVLIYFHLRVHVS